jgi:amino acid permease
MPCCPKSRSTISPKTVKKILPGIYWTRLIICAFTPFSVNLLVHSVQATLREPAKKNMYKGASLAYGVIAVSYWTVAFLGYAVFGNAVNPYLVNSFIGPDWLITLANIFAVIQVLGCYQVPLPVINLKSFH